jgi:hypothetical protein
MVYLVTTGSGGTGKSAKVHSSSMPVYPGAF